MPTNNHPMFTFSISADGFVTGCLHGIEVPLDGKSPSPEGMDAAFDNFCSSEPCCVGDHESRNKEAFFRYNPLAQWYDNLYLDNDHLLEIRFGDLRPDSVFTPDSIESDNFRYSDTRLGVLHALHLMYYDGWTINQILNLTEYYIVTMCHVGNPKTEIAVSVDKINGEVNFVAGKRSNDRELMETVGQLGSMS